jgi:copper(I)-binding protein
VTRWTRRLLVGAIALLVPALAGCEAGFNAPTLTYHPAANGASAVVGGITVDDAFVLGPSIGSSLPAGGQAGVFLSLAAQNNDRLDSATSTAASSVQLTTGPVTLTPGALVDLSGPTPQIVLNGLTSSLSGGQTVQLTLNFATAGSVTLQLPVEPAAYDYTTYSPPPPTPTATPTPTVTTTGKPKGKATPSASASPTS